MEEPTLEHQPDPSVASDEPIAEAIDIPTVDIDPQGDVFLICGSITKKRLRVYSPVMSLASDMFKAMFKPQFQEGITLASTNTVEIPLPDDDPDAMESVCNVFHLRNKEAQIMDNGAGHMSARQLLTIAMLCDKYQCQVAVAAAATCWLPSCDIEKSSDLHMLINAASLFRIDTAFRELGKLVIEGPVRHIDVEEEEHILVDVIEQLIGRRRMLNDDIIDFIERRLDNIMTRREERSRKGNLKHICNTCSRAGASSAMRQARQTSQPMASSLPLHPRKERFMLLF